MLRSLGVDAPPRPAPPTLRSIDFVELWVQDLDRARRLFERTFGFRTAAARTTADRRSVVLEQGRARVLVTEGLTATSEVTEFVRRHGSGVHEIGVSVDDVRIAQHAAIARGAFEIHSPRCEEDDAGVIVRSTVDILPGTQLTFVNRDHYESRFAPGFAVVGRGNATVGIGGIDHLAFVVAEGTRAAWVERLLGVLGLRELGDPRAEEVVTPNTAFTLSTLEGTTGDLLFAISEPLPSVRRGQVEEFLDVYGGPGVQHIAFGTDDIVHTVRRLREMGAPFVSPPPDGYYQGVRQRLGRHDLPWDGYARHGILIDGSARTHLAQIFTTPVLERPTVFLELIERVGARGFGTSNIRALYEAVEREQDRRGTLVARR